MSTIHQPIPFEDKQFWLAAVLADTTLTPGAKTLAAGLYLHHNTKTGRCDPGYATLVTSCGMSRDTVKRAAKNLRSAGYLDVTPGQNETSSVYRLALPANITRSSLTKKRSVPAVFDAAGVGANSPQGGCSVTTGCGDSAHRVGANSPQGGCRITTGGVQIQPQTGKEQEINREAEQGMNREENNDSERGGARSASPRCAPAAFVIENAPGKIIPFPVKPSQTPPAVPSLQTPPADPPPAASPRYDLHQLAAWIDRTENPNALPKATFRDVLGSGEYETAADVEAEIKAILCGA